MVKFIREYIREALDVKTQILNSDELLTKVDSIAEVIVNAYKNGKKVLVAGNGGSAADAQHIVAELVSKFNIDRPALNSIALTTNTSILTAVGNDYSHEYIFARQIEAYGQEGDIYIAISTSGNSKNIVKSIETAKNRGLKIIGFTGMGNGKMDEICDYLIKIPSDKTPIIQEAHIMIGHVICAMVEKNLFN